MERHKYFFAEPSPICARDFPKLLRPRAPDKEIHQDMMHFTAKTEIERVMDAIRSNGVLIDETDGKDTAQMLKVKAHATKKEMRKTLCEAGRKLRPKLHQKTHFQAVMALVNRQSEVLYRSSAGFVSKAEEGGEEVQSEAKQGETGKSELRKTQGTTLMRWRSQSTTPVSWLTMRSGSVPVLPRLQIDNTSPLRKRRQSKEPSPAAALTPTPIASATASSRFGNPFLSPRSDSIPGLSPLASSLRDPKAFTTPRWKGRKVAFMLPSPLTPTQQSPKGAEAEMDDREALGRRVLRTCRVIRCRSPVTSPRQLRKGEGHLMGGFGMSNLQVYQRVFSYE